jgi:hypothetical protein
MASGSRVLSQQPPSTQPSQAMIPPPTESSPGFIAPAAARAGQAGRSHKRWIIAGGAVLTCVIAIVVAVLLATAQPGPAPTPTPTPIPIVTPTKLKSILLSAEEVNTIMGGSHMKPSKVFEDMNDTSGVSNPNCLGALYTAQESVYAGSGWSAVSDQTLRESRADNPDSSRFWVNQTAVAFPSADQAGAFLNTSADKWEACAGQTVTVTDGSKQSTWTLGDVSRGGENKIVQVGTQEGAQGWACQHALSEVSNAVVEVIACSDQIGGEASQMADEMVASAAE